MSLDNNTVSTWPNNNGQVKGATTIKRSKSKSSTTTTDTYDNYFDYYFLKHHQVYECLCLLHHKNTRQTNAHWERGLIIHTHKHTPSYTSQRRLVVTRKFACEKRQSGKFLEWKFFKAANEYSKFSTLRKLFEIFSKIDTNDVLKMIKRFFNSKI